jgi:hypothetical protein
MGQSGTRDDANQKCRLTRHFADSPWSSNTSDSGS